jgi:hypothetical protein
MDDPGSFKIWVDLIYKILTIIGILIAGITAYGILLLTSRPEILIDAIAFWSPGAINGIESKALSAQICFLNPAMGSQVTSVFEIQSIDLELSPNKDPMWHFRPHAFLKQLVTEEIAGKKQFTAGVEELYHPSIMIGHGQQIVHVAFVSDKIFSSKKEYMKIHLKINYRIYNPLFVPFRNPKMELIEKTICVNILSENMESIFEKNLLVLLEGKRI